MAVGSAVAILIVLAVVALYSTPAPTPASSPSPTESASPSPTAVAVSPSPTAPPSPTATPIAPGDATIKVSKVTVPSEFRYVALGSGEDFRVVMLDLDAARATEVATVHVVGVQTAPAQTSASVSASSDGRVVLLTITVPEAQSSLYVLRPEAGESKLLLKGAPRQAVISPDGTRFALGRADRDPAMTGLWAGSVDDGTMKRLVADEPQFVGSPPVPFAFSPAGTLLVFGLGLGDTGYQAMLVPIGSAEARVDRAPGGTKIVGGDVTAIGPASGAEFSSEQEAFVWSSRGAFGGQTVAYTFDLPSKKMTELYRPSSADSLIAYASWRPRAAQFATVERPMVGGANVRQAVWLRDRSGSARKLGDYSFLAEMWWSRDGSKLFGRMGGDDATSGIADLLTAKAVMQFCLRGGTPGSCT
jgi:hypothetical protein